MSESQVFELLYRKLNPKQKEAVDTIEGPVMVVAGPGTGKTQILALRIANILKTTDTDPESILALTFTESGVYSMRKRLVSIVGNVAYRINIFTFHSFCNEVIKTYPDEFPRIISSQSSTDIDHIRIMEELISSSKLKLQYLKPYGDQFYYLRPVLSTIKNLKREKVSPDAFKELVAEQEKNFLLIPDRIHEKGAHKGKMKGEYSDLQKKIEKNKELCLLYEGYEKALEAKRLYDYEDMIIETVKAFETNQDLLLRIQEKYQYILADEHQDANNAQNKLLELLSNFHDNPNIFVVGDEKQAIFRFQGASLENFLYFRTLYPKAQIVSLEDNYRSTQIILDGAHSLIAHNKVTDEKLRMRLVSHQQKHVEKNHPHIKVCELTSQENEYVYIISEIKKKIAAGISPHDIAIIYRENRDAFPIVRELEKEIIPFVLASDQDILADEDIDMFILLLRTVSSLGSEELLARVLYADFLGMNHLDVHKVISCSAKNKQTLYDCLESRDKLEKAGVKNIEQCVALSGKLESWSRMAKNKNVVDVFETIVNESGFLSHIVSHQGSLEKLAKLESLFREAKELAERMRQAKLADFIGFIDTLKNYNVLIKTGVVGAEQGGVRLMTAHKAKGLEFEYVYIVNAYDTHWGNKREVRHFHIPLKGLESVGIDPNEDERRLFYVALTRARSEVTVSFPTRSARGESLLPSQFIAEINPDVCYRPTTVDLEKDLGTQKNTFAVRSTQGIELHDKEFLRKLFFDQGLSVTALNKYLKCPWDYFFNSLLRVPTKETKHQLYGTAIHDTLREFFNAYAREEDLSLATFLDLFEGHLRRKALSDVDFEESLTKGKESLAGYYNAYKGTWSRNLMTEFAITTVLPVRVDGVPESLLLRGNLDKIEIISDGKVNVVDYKTAKPKTRNAILGKTKDITGPEYFRQLTFYKLLLDKHNNAKYKMVSGEIDFIEADERGKHHKEQFEITEEHVHDLVSLLEKTVEEISTFVFWDKRCDDKDCQSCHLRNILASNKKPL